MSTAEEKLQELRNSLDEEIEDITNKMPWWKKGLIVLNIAIAVGGMAAACGFITVVSVGSGLIPCIAAMGVVIFVLIGLLVENLAAGEEADALEKKAEQMDEIVAELEAG